MPSTSRSTIRRLGIAAGVTAMLAAGTAVDAAVPGSEAASTTAPDLRSAKIVSLDTEDSRPEQVEYCFDERVSDPVTGGFALVGYDSAEVISATNTRVDVDDQRCVRAEFTSGTPLDDLTVAVVDGGVVTDAEGNGNIRNAVALTGSTVEPRAGYTTSPDFIRHQADATLNRITYGFDEMITAVTSADMFGFVTRSGDTRRGVDVVGINDDEHTVTIEFAEVDRVRDFVRVFVDAGAVSGDDRVAPEPDPQSPESLVAMVLHLEESIATADSGSSSDLNPVGARGGATTAPDLVDAADAAGSRNQIDFLFDEPVIDPDAGRFIAYTGDGTSHRGASAARTGSRSIRVTFEGIDDFIGDLVLVGVESGAVMSLDGDRRDGADVLPIPNDGATAGSVTNTHGRVALGRAESRPGFTDAPDLIAIDVEEAAGQVTFSFDEVVDDDVEIDPSRFTLVTERGEEIAGSEVLDITDNTVLVEFAETNEVEASVAATVQPGAALDFEGNANPIGAVAR